MKLQSIQAFIAPLSTPLAPALLYANEMYHTMVSLEIPVWMALVVSGIGIIGIEFTGALMCYNAISAWQKRDPAKTILAIVGAGVYGAIVMSGIFTIETERAKIFGFTVLLTLVSYLAYAIYESLTERTQENQRNVNNKIELLKQERYLKNAETRQIKAKGNVVQLSTEQTGQSSEQVEQGQIEVTELGQKIFDLMDKLNGQKVTMRQVANKVGCSPTTAGKWMEQYERSNLSSTQ